MAEDKEQTKQEKQEELEAKLAQDDPDAEVGDVVLVNDAVDAKGNKVQKGFRIKESEEWPKHRIAFLLREGHAKMKGSEVQTTKKAAPPTPPAGKK